MLVPFSYFITSYGCTQNQAEGGMIKALVEERGGYFTEDIDTADLVIINSCGVKQPTEHKIAENVRRIDKQTSRLVVTGCLPKINGNLLTKVAPGAIQLPIGSTNEIVNHLPNVLPGIEEAEEPFNIPKEPVFHNTNNLSAMIPIENGCLGHCSFCAIKYARGSTYSYDQEKIVKHAAEAIGKGAKELWLTGQDTATYGMDGRGNEEKGTNRESRLPQLVESLLDLEGQFRVRIGMMNPEWIPDIQSQIIDLMGQEKLYKFLHIPVQSGSTNVLNEMRREYTSELFEQVITSFRKELPEITFATDIIVGFPGETEQDFQQTVDMLERLKLEIVNVSKYGDRPKTPSSRRKDKIEPREINRRTRFLHSLLLELCKKSNEKWIGTEGSGFITKELSDNSQARNEAYRPIILSKNKRLGDWSEFKIVKASPTSLWGVDI